MGDAIDDRDDAIAGEGIVTVEGTVEDDDISDSEPTVAALARQAMSTPAAQRLRRRIRIRRVVARAGLLRVTPPLKAASCYRHVCNFRYADEMRQLVASQDARLACGG